MLGPEAVVEVLDEILTAELTAINQYFVHAELRQSWGFAAWRPRRVKHSRRLDRLVR